MGLMLWRLLRRWLERLLQGSNRKFIRFMSEQRKLGRLMMGTGFISSEKYVCEGDFRVSSYAPV